MSELHEHVRNPERARRCLEDDDQLFSAIKCASQRWFARRNISLAKNVAILVDDAEATRRPSQIQSTVVHGRLLLGRLVSANSTATRKDARRSTASRVQLRRPPLKPPRQHDRGP